MAEHVKILVTGGRDFHNVSLLRHALDRLFKKNAKTELCIIQGGAKGADKLAKDWAEDNGIACITMDAPWEYYKRGAGPIRNAWMLKWTKPSMVYAFPTGGPGTQNMLKQAKSAGVPSREYV